MDTTLSMSKGSFAFKGKSSTKSGKVKDELRDFTDEPWYKTYSKVLKKLEEQYKNIDLAVSENVLGDLVNFISQDRGVSYGIPAAILLTGVNLPDHGSLFKGLSARLYDNVTHHIALLNSADCPTIRNTVEQMTARFMNNSEPNEEKLLDSDSENERNIFSALKKSECTLPTLESWYNDLQGEEESNTKRRKKSEPASKKLVVIIPDFESFSPKVFQELILILSGYLEWLPLVLIIGVATSVMALHNSLPHSVISRLSLQLFQSQPSVYFLNNTVEKVFLTGSCPFQLGRRIFKFLIDVFLFYDFSVQGFIKGVKYSMVEHFYNSELSVLCCPVEDLDKVVQSLDEGQLEKLRRLPSFRTYVESQSKQTQVELIINNKYFKTQVGVLMKNLRRHLLNFHVALRLLHVLVSSLPHAPLGKQVRELYCEAMLSKISENSKFIECFTLLGFLSKDELLEKMNKLLQILEQESGDSTELEEVSKRLTALKKDVEEVGLNVEVSKNPMSNSPSKINLNLKNRRAFKEQLSVMSQKEKPVSQYEHIRVKVLMYLREDVFSVYLLPPVSLPFHEVLVFDNLAAMKRHIVGIPRAALHTALNYPHHYLQCDCCKISDSGEILASMPDICIAYKLHLESGALINMYDWLQSFVTIVSPNEKERDEQKIDPKIQARFTRAVAELQFLGFIKSSKQKTDHVTRLTWGGTS